MEVPSEKEYIGYSKINWLVSKFDNLQLWQLLKAMKDVRHFFILIAVPILVLNINGRWHCNQ